MQQTCRSSANSMQPRVFPAKQTEMFLSSCVKWFEGLTCLTVDVGLVWELWDISGRLLALKSNVIHTWPNSRPTVFRPGPLLLLQPCYLLFFIPPLPLQPAVTEVNPKSVVVCVWTFETNGHGQQSRDNPSRLCKYQCACLKLNVNALIWNANCVLCDMLKHRRAALWDGKLKASLSPLLIPTGPPCFWLQQ